jgi:hypothetical protein
MSDISFRSVHYNNDNGSAYFYQFICKERLSIKTKEIALHKLRNTCFVIKLMAKLFTRPVVATSGRTVIKDMHYTGVLL